MSKSTHSQDAGVLAEFSDGVTPIDREKPVAKRPASKVVPLGPAGAKAAGSGVGAPVVRTYNPPPSAGPTRPMGGPFGRDTVQRELYDHMEKRAIEAEQRMESARAELAALNAKVRWAEGKQRDAEAINAELAQAAAEAKAARIEAERSRDLTKKLNEEIDAHRRTIQRENHELKARLAVLDARLDSPPVGNSPGEPNEAAGVPSNRAPSVHPTTDSAAETDSVGSIQRAMVQFTTACLLEGITKVAFVGGTPAYRKQLDEAKDRRLDFRFVEGDNHRAVPIPSAQLVIVWGGSPLDHSVSEKFPNSLVISNRGLTGLLREAAERIPTRKR